MVHRASWRRALVVLVAVAAGLVVPVAQSADAASALQATQVRRVSPLDATGHLRSRYNVVASGRGYCWTTSFVHGRAYRCFKGTFIYDPCWKETGRRSVVCLPRPWSSDVTRVRLTRRLPPTTRAGGTVWGLRLGGGIGVNCLVSMGASGSVGNRGISYLCRRGWVLLDVPDRRNAVWTIATAKRVGHHYELRGRKPLVTAWKPVVG